MTILNIENVSLHFSGCDKPILHELNYQIKSGDFVIVLGSNGSGKSSLLKLLHQYYQPSVGNIYFLQKSLHLHEALSGKVATLTQNCNESLFSSLTLYENYLLIKQQKFFSRIHHQQEREFLQKYLLSFNPNLSQKLDLLVDQLSGGEKQAFALALTVFYPPTLLLLDEHTSALDPKASEQVMQITANIVKEHRITCLLTTHDLDIALRYGSRILMLNDGKIIRTINSLEKDTLNKENLIKLCY